MNWVNEVFYGDALTLCQALPDSSVDAVITDPMYGSSTDNPVLYDWGYDPVRGDPEEWWARHGPIYQECRRVLQPGGSMAWAAGCKFSNHFTTWFGGHRIWSFTRYLASGLNAFGHVWIVQTKEQEPIPFPDRDSLILWPPRSWLSKRHPCPKVVPEMEFLVGSLSKPGDIVLDPMCGIGTTLVAAQNLERRFVGCDLSENYCNLALRYLYPTPPLMKSFL